MIEIINILRKKRKSINDMMKILIFGFFVVVAVMYIGQIKPLESDY